MSTPELFRGKSSNLDSVIERTFHVMPVPVRRQLATCCSGHAADHGVKDLLTMTFPTAKGLEAQRARAYHGLVELVRRAQGESKLRADFVPQDLDVLLMANAGVVQAMGRDAPDGSKRFVALMIDAFRAERARRLPTPPTRAQVYRAMLRRARAWRRVRR